MARSPTAPIAPAQANQAGSNGQGKRRVPARAALEEAIQHYNAGRLPRARRISEQILVARPDNAEAHNLLGAVLKAQGDDAAAVKALQKAIYHAPKVAMFHANLGEIERQRGKLQQAAIALQMAVSLDPRSPQALNNLGILHFDRKEYDEAVSFYERAIAVTSTYPEAYNNLGNALRALGKQDEAADNYQRALLLRENYPEAYNNLASVLRDKDQVAEAEHAYRKAISLNPKYLEAYGNLAAMFVQLDKSDEALRILGEALAIDGKHVPTLLQVARVQLEKGNHVQAEQAVRFALSEDPEKADSHVVLGQILHETDRYLDAEVAYKKAISLDPELAEAYNYRGICLKSLGRMEEAQAAFLKCLDLNPNMWGVYSNLADLEKFSADHPLFKNMTAIMAAAEDPQADRYTGLHFALGKAYDDIGEYDKAFSHFSMGATLKRAKLDYNEAETFAFFDSIMATFTKDFFAAKSYAGHPTTTPVFILGMPRSGSTLVEQVLSSHPDVFGAGEIKVFSRQLHGLRSRFPGLPKFPDIVTKMNAAQYQIIADGYAKATQALSPGAAKITDKLLTNYYFAGLLHILFPHARIINTRRNAIDTCLSAYTKLFKDDMPHSYDLGELGRYYRKYEDVMDHWQEVLPPGTIKTIVYEEVVDRLDDVAREIVDFVGLPWNDACLDFHKSERPVKTASVAQVRKPVYRSSLARWKRYGDNLKPLIEALGVNPETGRKD